MIAQPATTPALKPTTLQAKNVTSAFRATSACSTMSYIAVKSLSSWHPMRSIVALSASRH